MPNVKTAARARTRVTSRSRVAEPRWGPLPLREWPPFAFAEPGTPEWFVAWQGLADASGDADREAFDERFGEVWQYMGAVQREEGWTHEFRHRNHPRTQERWLLRVPASPEWRPADVRR